MLENFPVANSAISFDNAAYELVGAAQGVDGTFSGQIVSQTLTITHAVHNLSFKYDTSIGDPGPAIRLVAGNDFPVSLYVGGDVGKAMAPGGQYQPVNSSGSLSVALFGVENAVYTGVNQPLQWVTGGTPFYNNRTNAGTGTQGDDFPTILEGNAVALTSSTTLSFGEAGICRVTAVTWVDNHYGPNNTFPWGVLRTFNAQTLAANSPYTQSIQSATGYDTSLFTPVANGDTINVSP